MVTLQSISSFLLLFLTAETEIVITPLLPYVSR